MTMDFEKVRRGEYRTIDKKFHIAAFRSYWIIGELVYISFGEPEYLDRALVFPTLKAAKAYILRTYYNI